MIYLTSSLLLESEFAPVPTLINTAVMSVVAHQSCGHLSYFSPVQKLLLFPAAQGN